MTSWGSTEWAYVSENEFMERSWLAARVCHVRRAFDETRYDIGRNSFSLRQRVQSLDCLVAHLVGALSYLIVAQPVLQQWHLRRKRIAHRDDQVLGVHPRLHAHNSCPIGRRSVLCPTTDRDEYVEFRIGREDVIQLLRGRADVIVVVDRTACGLRLSILPRQMCD